MDRVEVESLQSLSDVEIEGFASTPVAGAPLGQLGHTIAHSYPWLSKITTLNLDLCGMTSHRVTIMHS